MNPRRTALTSACLALVLIPLNTARATDLPTVVDIPTRPGITQRLLMVPTSHPKAAVILFAGGHGGLQISEQGELTWGKGNFLIRTRQRFADQDLLPVIIDAPSDLQTFPFLNGNRIRSEHVQDVSAVIDWVRQQTHLPIWLVGTSRGTQSVAYVATELSSARAPDGIVLTSSILSDSQYPAVPAMPLEKISVPTLVIHHELDQCKACSFSGIPSLMAKLTQTPRKALISYRAGITAGGVCEAFAYHGYNGIEAEVVEDIAQWIKAN